MERLWILGASDPEMVLIENLLRDCGESVAYAAIGGIRVHPGNAYKATGFRFPSESEGVSWHNDCDLDQEISLVFVECSVAGIGRPFQNPTIVDHHRPGDPGYGKGPEDFWSASSIGQVFRLLTNLAETCPVCGDAGCWGHPSDEQEMAAAADHCLESAYRGKCPGINPDRLMQWRGAVRAAFQKRTREDVLTDINDARNILREAVAPHCSVCGSRIPEQGWCDYCNGITSEPTPVVIPEYADLRNQHVPELPEAAAREGIAFLSTVKDRDGREKVVLQAASSDLVSRFLAGHIVPGLKDMYGDPARGFAGGYV